MNLFRATLGETNGRWRRAGRDSLRQPPTWDSARQCWLDDSLNGPNQFHTERELSAFGALQSPATNVLLHRAGHRLCSHHLTRVRMYFGIDANECSNITCAWFRRLRGGDYSRQ